MIKVKLEFSKYLHGKETRQMRKLLAFFLAVYSCISLAVFTLPPEHTFAAYETCSTTGYGFTEVNSGKPVFANPPEEQLKLLNDIVITSEVGSANLLPTEYRWSIYHQPAFSWSPYPKIVKIWVDARFTNYGADALNVVASVISCPANVTVSDGTVSLGNIAAGVSAWSKDAFSLVIDLTNPQDPNKGIFWKVEYNDTLGQRHVLDNIPQLPLTLPGTRNAPVVKIIWEQEPVTSMESGDPTHVLFRTGAPSNAQFNPPVVKGAKKTIDYYAVVTDIEEGGNVAQVFAYVFHPHNSPPPYSTGIDPRGPFFKYDIPFRSTVQVLPGGRISDTDKRNEVAAVNAAYNAHLITFTDGYTLNDAINALNQGTAILWKGTALIDYEQPAGEYTVNVFAIDHTIATSAALANTFTYVAVSGIEVDFNKVVYGSVGLDVEKMIAGDLVWDANPAPVSIGEGQPYQATVRNIGNTWAHVTLNESDMGFGKDINGTWNVVYGACMGDDITRKVYYYPGATVTLPNFLELSKQAALNLSIKVHRPIPGQNLYIGVITVGSAIEPFPVVGP